jgi:peroxiredoxin
MLIRPIVLLLVTPLLGACFADSDSLTKEEIAQNNKGILISQDENIFSHPEDFSDNLMNGAPHGIVLMFELPEKNQDKIYLVNSVDDLLNKLNWRKKAGKEKITNEDRDFIASYTKKIGMDFDKYTYLYHYRNTSSEPIKKGYMPNAVMTKVVESTTNPESLDIDFQYSIKGDPTQEFPEVITAPPIMRASMLPFEVELKKTKRTQVNFIYKRATYAATEALNKNKNSEGGKFAYF